MSEHGIYPPKELLDRVMNALVEVRSDVRRLASELAEARTTQIEMQKCLGQIREKTALIGAVVPDELNVRLDRLEQDKKRQDRFVGAAIIAAIGGLGTTLWNLITKGSHS